MQTNQQFETTPFYRFRPEESELLDVFLRRRIFQKQTFDEIREVDFYAHEPAGLVDLSMFSNQKLWFYFTKIPQRINRSTKEGHWRHSNARTFVKEGEVTLGSRQPFIFRLHDNDRKTDWHFVEYKLITNNLPESVALIKMWKTSPVEHVGDGQQAVRVVGDGQQAVRVVGDGQQAVSDVRDDQHAVGDFGDGQQALEDVEDRPQTEDVRVGQQPMGDVGDVQQLVGNVGGEQLLVGDMEDVRVGQQQMGDVGDVQQPVGNVGGEQLLVRDMGDGQHLEDDGQFLVEGDIEDGNESTVLRFWNASTSSK